MPRSGGPGGGPKGLVTRLGRGAPAVAAALSIAVLLAGCQVGSSFQYVSHRAPDGVDLYFKVPPNWKIFNTSQVLVAQNGKLGPTQEKQIANGEWIATMSNRPGVTAKQASFSIGDRFPAATVLVRPLGQSERDSMNFATMRSLLLNADPLTASSGYEVLNYDEFTLPGGIRGIKMIVNITSGSPVLTFGQVTAVDANTNYIFTLGVGCEASCWGLNASAVTSLLDSWTLKEQSP
jgi:hypothetical protein